MSSIPSSLPPHDDNSEAVHALNNNINNNMRDGHGNATPEVSAHELAMMEEQAAFTKVVSSMLAYESYSLHEVARWERQLKMLPARHLRLPCVGQRLQAMANEARPRIQANQHFLRALLTTQSLIAEGEEGQGSAFPNWRVELGRDSTNGDGMNIATTSTTNNTKSDALKDTRQTIDERRSMSDGITKVRYIFKNLMRDWSEEGLSEREESYGRMIAELKRLLRPDDGQGNRSRVLVPGAGLGRLVLDVCVAGYRCEGCEWSYYMLLTSDFMLNSCAAREHTVFPFVLETCNVVSTNDQMRSIQVPDVGCGSLNIPIDAMSMSAGDFCELYSSKDMESQFDAVLTCFFIDTAQNIAEYIEVSETYLKHHENILLYHGRMSKVHQTIYTVLYIQNNALDNDNMIVYSLCCVVSSVI